MGCKGGGGTEMIRLCNYHGYILVGGYLIRLDTYRDSLYRECDYITKWLVGC